MLRLSFATGTEPGKWFDRFRANTAHRGLKATGSDDPIALLIAGEADVALARVPSDPQVRLDARLTATGRETHTVRLYTEAPGVAVPRDSVYHQAGGDIIDADDLSKEHVNYRIADDARVDVDALRSALQVVAANVGIAIAPRPLLKVLAKKQVIVRGLDDAAVPATDIALVWFRDCDSDAIQDFVGVARGRGANSSRQASPKRSARDKAKAKQARRASEKTSLEKGNKRAGQRRRRT